MSGAVEMTDGLAVTLDVPAFSADDPEGWVLQDDIVELPSLERLARVAAVEERRAKKKGVTVKLEIPDFLPEDIENWKSSAGRVELRRESRSWHGEVSEAHAARVPTINEVYALRRGIRNREKAAAARALAKALTAPDLGGDLGERDRRLAYMLMHFAPGVLSTNYCIIWGLTRGIAFEGGLWFGQQEEHCRPKDDCDHELTSCSGIWRGVADLFPKTDTEDRRAHLVERLRSLEITEAPGPWPGNKNKIYTLDDLSADQMQSAAEEFPVALEAFLHAHHEYAAAASLTAPPKTCEGEEFATQGRRAEGIPRATDAGTEPTKLREEFAEKSELAVLRDALAPAATAEQIEELEAVIRAAQVTRPEDPEAFVSDVNRILDAQNLRLSVEGEEHLARLSMKKGSISLAVAGGRGNQGFRGKALRVVPVDESYALRGARPRARSSEPAP